MDNNEKLGWIERVDHASEDQAKRTLKFMILKCNTKTDTIARAIRDAIERHTPTPTIVYQQPESEDDGEAELASSPKKSSKKKKKKKDQDGSSQDEEDAPSKISKKRRRTRRGDINADPLIGEVILKKTKTKLKRNKKRSSDHDEEHSRPDTSKKNKSMPASRLGADAEPQACDNPVGRPYMREGPPVIDLVTSSDDETCDPQQSDNENLDDRSSHDVSSENNSSDDESSDNDSSDDESSEDEQKDIVRSQGVRVSQDSPMKRTPQAGERNVDDNSNAAQSITISMAKASIRNDDGKMSPFDLGKKRKAPEHAEEDVHNDHDAQTASDTQANKRAKHNQPTEPHFSLHGRTCRYCGMLFQSVGQLIRHQIHCKSAIATPVSHLRFQLP